MRSRVYFSLSLRSVQLAVVVVVLALTAWLYSVLKLSLYVSIIIFSALSVLYGVLAMFAATPIYLYLMNSPGWAFFIELGQAVYWAALAIAAGVWSPSHCFHYREQADLDSPKDRPGYPDYRMAGIVHTYEEYLASQYALTGGDKYCQANWAMVGLVIATAVLFVATTVIQGYYWWWPIVASEGFAATFLAVNFYPGSLFVRPEEDDMESVSHFTFSKRTTEESSVCLS